MRLAIVALFGIIAFNANAGCIWEVCGGSKPASHLNDAKEIKRVHPGGRMMSPNTNPIRPNNNGVPGSDFRCHWATPNRYECISIDRTTGRVEYKDTFHWK